MATDAMVSKLTTLGLRVGIVMAVVGDRYTLTASAGAHSLDVLNTDDARLVAHFIGFAENQPGWRVTKLGEEEGNCPGNHDSCERDSAPRTIPGLEGYVVACSTHAASAAWTLLLS